MSRHESLESAKKNKNDEFYTQYSDIEKEVLQYDKLNFREKTVYCPCDSLTSNFWKFFVDNFAELGINKLIASHYEDKASQVSAHIYDGVNINEIIIEGNGDFRSESVKPFWDSADLIVTNPPFSLFKEFIPLVMKNGNKKCLIMGSMNAVSYKDIFPLIKNDLLWPGNKFNGTAMLFRIPDNYQATGTKTKVTPNGDRLVAVPAVWYTNLDHNNRYKDIEFHETYSPGKYQKYDNFEAININKKDMIPNNYLPCWYKCEHHSTCIYAINNGNAPDFTNCQNKCNGVMGVPISFISDYNPKMFEILGTMNTPIVDNRKIYKRIFIRWRNSWCHTAVNRTDKYF